jgi:hypothetical protein
MNKFYLLCFIVVATVSTFAQNTIFRNPNIVPYGGTVINQNNTNEYTNYYGVYADVPVLKNWKFNLGVWGVYNIAKYKENLSQYNSTTNDATIGLNGGIYLRGTSKYSLYLGIAVGYQFSNGTDSTITSGYKAWGKKSDGLLRLNTNINLFKEGTTLTRTQLTFLWQTVLNSKKTLIENNEPQKIVDSWNSGYYELLIKESLADIRMNQSGLIAQPKIGVGIDHHDQGRPENYILLGELAFKGKQADDFFCITYQYLIYPGTNAKFFNLGASLNVLEFARFLRTN